MYYKPNRIGKKATESNKRQVGAQEEFLHLVRVSGLQKNFRVACFVAPSRSQSGEFLLKGKPASPLLYVAKD